MPLVPDAGSFRDPGGRVYVRNGRVFRTVNECAVADFDFTQNSGLFAELSAKGWITETTVVDKSILGEVGQKAHCVLEHTPVPFISYPYEWPFPALKAAALLHLDVHLAALNRDVTLADSSAYNIQFIGTQPVFIDRLSFVRYREGEIWSGHRQFCEQFLNPLLLRAKLGISHNAWFRGSPEGISTAEMRRILPWHQKLSWNVFLHVVLQDVLGGGGLQSGAGEEVVAAKKTALPKPKLQNILRGLRSWIDGLNPAHASRTVWRDYARNTSYSPDEENQKHRFVADYVAAARPKILWDMGCNTGEYSLTALEAGASYAVGFDADNGALEAGFERAKQSGEALLLLNQDATNPTPDQGWNEKERKSLQTRAPADGILALALVHHLALGRNIPLPQVVEWIVGLASTGVIEFIPKDDAMSQKLLRFKGDIFPDYSFENFLTILSGHGRIIGTRTISAGGRAMVRFAQE